MDANFEHVTESVCNVFVPHQREKLMDSVCFEFQGKLNILVSAQPFLVLDLLEAYSRGFPCLYFQTLSHICFSLSQKCNQRNREMKQRGRKHSMYMGLPA
ncbi:hypothetical protein Ahy_B04g072727 isoform D [Arachis hypogaea]|uniref:Uncharacterized protein n=1 Tax=Arachis hypogaea TaxID=3818 RepID=A0A444ZNM6_ARAHY|nr:hypothetical protein Ahy_B04g072727 isoform D [Arachis hypogaea]